MLTLYTFHNSICTQKVFMTLAEKDLWPKRTCLTTST